MSDVPDYKPPRSIKSLHVMPNSGKVDQLRKEFADAPVRPDSTGQIEPQSELEVRVVEALRTVYDPELPVNLYDLGLIYSLTVDPADSSVHVTMTLTAPGCPVAGTLPGEVQRKIASVPGVSRVKVELVWEPPWTKARMSEAALLELGLL